MVIHENQAEGKKVQNRKKRGQSPSCWSVDPSQWVREYQEVARQGIFLLFLILE